MILGRIYSVFGKIVDDFDKGDEERCEEGEVERREVGKVDERLKVSKIKIFKFRFNIKL